MYVCEPKDRIAVGCIVKPMQAWQGITKMERFRKSFVQARFFKYSIEHLDQFPRGRTRFCWHDCRADRDGVGTLDYFGIIGSVLFELEGRGTEEGCRVCTIESQISYIISSAVGNNMGLCCFVTRNGLS